MDAIISWVIDLFLSILNAILSPIFSLLDGVNIPAFDTFSSFLTTFWDFIFNSIGYVRSALLLDQFEWNLILTILTIRILGKPIIAIFKMFVGWFAKLWPF